VSKHLSTYESEHGTKQSCHIENIHFVEKLYFNPGLSDQQVVYYMDSFFKTGFTVSKNDTQLTIKGLEYTVHELFGLILRINFH
jgi:hypothetical protein